MKLLERVLAFGIFVGLTFRDGLGFLKAENIIMVCGTILGLFYLFSTWWILRPGYKNARTITISILYGITCWSLAFALIFQLLYLEGSNEMTIMSIILLLVSIGVDTATSVNKPKLINSWMVFRIGILTSFTLTFFLLPDDSRIALTYRNYPDLLKIYDANRDRFSFFVIQRAYFNNQIQYKNNGTIDF